MTTGNQKKKLFILGGGGHASVVADVLHNLSVDFDGIIAKSIADKNLERSNLGLFSEENFLDHYTADTAALINGIGMLPKSNTRKSVFEFFHQAGFGFKTVVHPKAIVSLSAVIGRGAQVFAGCVIQSYAEVGDQTIVNTGATIDHGSKIGAHSHIAPGATICGNVNIGEGCFIGAGATVVNNISISPGALVKAGTVVARNI